MKKIILTIFVFITLQTIYGINPTECNYSVSTNTLSIQFSEPVNSANILLGLLNFSDSQSNLQFTGGDILNPDQLTDYIDINLVYGTIIDERNGLMYWGKTNQQAVELETMNLDELTLSIGAGAFLDSLFQPDPQNISLPVTITDSLDAQPQIDSIKYDAGLNLLHLYFDRIVQFDQLAEDLSCLGGTGFCPGNGELDGGDYPEDINGNGVLDMERNINVFKISFSSDIGTIVLEGYNSIIQTSDSDEISIYLTNSDARKLELNVINNAAEPVLVTVGKGAFVDLNYNPNENHVGTLEVIPDDIPLELTNATYDLGKNELELYFDNSRNVTFSNPFPVYSKIIFSDGENQVALGGIKLISALGTTLILKELLFNDQSSVEQLILGSSSGINLILDAYAVYDENGNGNLPVEGFPLNIIGETNDPVLNGVTYESGMNRIILDWTPDMVTYYKSIQLFQLSELLAISGISLVNQTTGEALSITSASISRNSAKTKTYLDVTEEDSGWIEMAGNNGDVLTISIEPYTFFSSGNTDNNGNLETTDFPLSYTADTIGPIITSMKVDYENKLLKVNFDKNIDVPSANLTTVTLLVNDNEVVLNDLSVVENGDASTEIDFLIPESEFDNLTAAIPQNEIINIEVILPGDSFKNMDETSGIPCIDFNGNNTCDDSPEPFNDFGSDNIADPDEPGYPGSCSVSGFCSDPAIDSEDECESYCSDGSYNSEYSCYEFDGTCSNPRKHNKSDCEDAGATWTPDNTWTVLTWTQIANQSDCENYSGIWTPNLDPAGDNYDSVMNPDGTENNGEYDMGESFTDIYPNGVWDAFEPNIFPVVLGRYLWNKSFRAFAEPSAQMFFTKVYESDDVMVMVEESVWIGRCHNDDKIKASSCTSPGMEYINGRCVYLGVSDEETCLDQSTDAVWTFVDEADVEDIAEFYLQYKDSFTNNYGQFDDLDGNGKLTIVLYDISDENGKGANDTNSSLFRHGYFSLSDTADDFVDAGDFLYLDIYPQYVYNGSAPIPDTGTMYNALVHEFTKLLITQNEPDEEVWLKEGLAFFEQKRILGDVKFFGNGTDPGTTAANQLTYISFSKKNREDQHNVYLFLNYLFEKYSGATGWEIIDEIASNGAQGIESVNQALSALGYDATMKEIFIDYATACFLDVQHEMNIYNNKYSMANVDLYGPPASKNAAVLKFTESKPPPYSQSGVPPWSFNYYLIVGFTVSILDNKATFLSPLLGPADDLIFDGYDGINFRSKKIILKSGFSENMDPLYEVVDFDIDPENARGVLPVSTNSIDGMNFEFKHLTGVCEDGVSTSAEECCTANDGIWDGESCDAGTADWIWSGNKNMIIIVAKVDDTQPPASYDFILTNVTTPPDFSDFYVLQNPGVRNFLDLYVASQRPIFDEYGIEGPKITITSQYDTSYVLLNSIPSPNDELVLYYSPWTLGNWDHYTLIYEGTDQNGNPVQPDIVEISTTYLSRNAARVNNYDDTAALQVYDDISNALFVCIENDNIPQTGEFRFDIEGVEPVSRITYFGSDDVELQLPVKLSFHVDESLNVDDIRVYHLTSGGWINIGGTVIGDEIQTYADEMGYFLLATGDTHLPAVEVTVIPEKYTLDQNFPNPFNPVTNIRFAIPEDEFVNINIYNLQGQLVKTLVNGGYSAGDYTLVWDGLNNAGEIVPSGVYFTRINTDNYSKTIKMVLLK